MDAAAWNERYAAHELVWTAEPNRFVVEELAGAAPGTALDVACGEGRNAVWLAGQGWRVRAVDFAEAGVAKGRRLAEAAGVDVEWVVADVTSYEPAAAFDLVLVCYLHLDEPVFEATLRRLTGALAPGGVLLVIGHHLDNLAAGVGGPQDPAVLHDHTALAAALGGIPGIAVEKAERVERPVSTPHADGERTALDAVVRARRV